jgi:hypothetical protein
MRCPQLPALTGRLVGNSRHTVSLSLCLKAPADGGAISEAELGLPSAPRPGLCGDTGTCQTRR